MFRRALCLLVVLLWLPVSLLHAADAELAHIVILHVNDVHGQTLSSSAEGKPTGGYARLSTVVTRVRQEVGADHVLVVHAGDEFSRGDDMTNASGGAANISLMNQIGFNLMTPGNGDFYAGVGTLQKRIGEANFPVLTSNVTYRQGGKQVSLDSGILVVADVRIGVLGLCFLHKLHPASLPLTIEYPQEAAMRIVPQLREKADIVLALNHIGLQEDRRLAGAVAGIDVIIGGHTHTSLPRGNRVTGPDERSVLIAQAGEHLRYVGRVDLFLQRQAGKWTLDDAQAQLIPLDASVPEDPAIKAAIARMWPTTAPTTAPAAAPVAEPAYSD